MKRTILITSLMITAALFFSCAASRITVDEAYNALRPVKQLELPEQVEDNLVIVIENVADEGTSYKNFVELYVNDKLVEPNWLVTNVQDTWEYRLKVRPGYYKINAKYFAYIGWGEDDYEIVSDELVLVRHDQRTVVSTEIVKKPNGEPVNNTMYFKTKTENLDGVPASSGTVNMDAAASTAVSPASQIDMQINTSPEHAKIIIDDTVVGESPLKYAVDRNSDHIIQASAPGYKTRTRFFNKDEFADKKSIYVILNLEKE